MVYANRLSGETQQGLFVQILLGLSLQHSFLPGVGQNPFRNEQLRVCYQMRQVREFLYGWLQDRRAREDRCISGFCDLSWGREIAVSVVPLGRKRSNEMGSGVCQREKLCFLRPEVS